MSLNTTPRTWVAAEIVTAAELNTEVRDAIAGLQAAWTAYIPVWTAVSVNPALGNGSFAGSAYYRVGKTILFRIVLTMGTTTTYGTGQWILTPPVAPVGGAVRVPIPGDAYDTGANAYHAWATFFTAGLLYVYCDPVAAAGAARGVASAAPFAWGNGDQLVLAGSYEAA